MKSNKKPLNLANDNIRKLIWTFAIPGIISQVMTAVYNLVDQIFIGNGVSSLAISATIVCMPLTSIVTAVAALIGMGCAANFNLSVGRGQMDRAGNFLGNSLLYLCVAGLLIGAITLGFLHPMLRAFGSTDVIMEYAVPYAGILCIGLPFGIFATGCSYIIRSDGAPNYSMFVLLAGAVFNLIADPLFLFGFHMGISGIALATTLGQVLSAVLCLYYLIKKFHTVPIKRSFFRFQSKLLGEVAVSGSAVFMTHICAIIVLVIQNNSFGYYGALSIYGSETVLAAVGAISKVTIVLMSAVIGVALGCQPIIGFTYGHKSYKRVKETYFTAIRYTAIISTAAFLILQIFPKPIIGLFGDGDELFYSFAVRYIRISLMMTFLGGVLPVSSTFFTAIGKAKIGMKLTVFKQVILLIPLTLILPRFIGIDGVLAANPIAELIIFITVVIIARREMKDIDRLESEESVNNE